MHSTSLLIFTADEIGKHGVEDLDKLYVKQPQTYCADFSGLLKFDLFFSQA